jgi:hypothetical protein
MPRFSRNTIIEVVDALNLSTHVDINRFILKFEMERADRDGTKPQRKYGIIEYLVSHPDEKGPSEANLFIEITEYLLEERLEVDPWASPEDLFPKLVRSLKHDGYVIEEGKLKTILPEHLQLAETESELDSLLEKFQFSTAKGHFEQAISAYTRGDWASANAQLRSFVESLFDSIAEILVDDKTKLPPKSHNRRELLTKLSPPFLLTELNEWEIGGKGGFVQGFWNRLHPEGSHPGLSDEEDSTFRLYLVIIVASHYLRRLDRRIRKETG